MKEEEGGGEEDVTLRDAYRTPLLFFLLLSVFLSFKKPCYIYCIRTIYLMYTQDETVYLP